jgi:hypothetical protein
MRHSSDRGWFLPGVCVAGLFAFTVSGCVGSMDSSGGPEPTGPTQPPVQPGPNPGPNPGPGPTPLPTDPDTKPTAPAACVPAMAPSTPARLWRLTDKQYGKTVAALLGGRSKDANRDLTTPTGIAFPFGVVNENDRFSSKSVSYKIDDLSFSNALNAGERVAGLLVEALSKGCLGTTAPFAGCIESLIVEKGAVAFRRPLTRDEVTDYVALATQFEPKVGRQAAAQHAFHALLVAPPFLFRTELGETRSGKLMLAPYEIAAALSYSLTDGPPDEPLWQDAANGALTDKNVIARHVSRLLGTSLATEPMLRFLREYFRYDLTTELAKAEKFHNARALVEDTDAFVRATLAEAGRRDFLKTMLTSNTVYASAKTATNYGLKTVATESERLNAPQRLGLLTHPSWLSSFSQPADNDPIRRGRFVQESLLCGHVPDIDIGEVPPIPEDATRTLRENLAVHTQNGTCNGCHMMMDPLGLAFEGFDHYGRVRTIDNNKPVDTSGSILGSGDKDGPFKNLNEFITRLTSSKKVTQCFASHAFEAWMGRTATAADGCSVARAVTDYEQANGDLGALMTSLFTSDSFLVRKL